MRAALNALYKTSGLLAGFFLVAIAVLSLIQIGGRLAGIAAHSYDEFAGYCMAASSFLGLAWTFRCNEHIRMTLVLHHVQGTVRRAMALAALAASAFIVGFFAWWTGDMVWTSYELNDVSQGLVPVKLWIPQSGMALGLAIMLVAMLDDLLLMVRAGTTSFDAAETAKAADQPGFER
jgi:TRAP-type C4-dicarboxylate transport system permease small subunit